MLSRHDMVLTAKSSAAESLAARPPKILRNVEISYDRWIWGACVSSVTKIRDQVGDKIRASVFLYESISYSSSNGDWGRSRRTGCSRRAALDYYCVRTMTACCPFSSPKELSDEILASINKGVLLGETNFSGVLYAQNTKLLYPTGNSASLVFQAAGGI